MRSLILTVTVLAATLSCNSYRDIYMEYDKNVDFSAYETFAWVPDAAVWSGSAEGDIYDPSYIHYHVHPAIDRIMKKFPVRSTHRSKHSEVLKGKNPIVRSDNIGGIYDSGSIH